MGLGEIQAELLNICKSKNIEAIKASSFWQYLKDLETVEQEPAYHSEGNVLNHTLMVCQKYFDLLDTFEYSDFLNEALLCACLFHDIGKLKTTTIIDGKIRSPHHTSVGASMTREILWHNYNLCGSKEAFEFRELVCSLVQYHMYLPHLFDTPEDELEQKYTRVADLALLTPEYSLGLQYSLSLLDTLGRQCEDKKDKWETLFLADCEIDKLGILCGPYQFTDNYIKREYFKGKNLWRGQSLYDATWGNVVILCGLPGTGKDTFIKNDPLYSTWPMLSLDDIRKELHITNADNQGPVLQLAKERAKEYLREHRSFVWNATNLVKDRRSSIIELCEDYGAHVILIYLETTNLKQIERNNNRKDVVPQNVIDRMRSRISIPTPDEAYKVLWYMV